MRTETSYNPDQAHQRQQAEDLGHRGEELVVDFFRHMKKFETRLSTTVEDSGVIDIGPRQTIDAVAYLEGQPAMGLQITTAASKEVRAKKLQEMRDHPFLRLPEMKPGQPAIPRVLVYLDRKNVATADSGDGQQASPEAALQILESAINSLQFDLTQTKNPSEITAVKNLISILQEEKKQYLH